MILYYLAKFLIYILYLLLAPIRLLGDYFGPATLPAEFTESIMNIGQNVSILNNILPINTLFSIVGLVIGFEVLVIILKVIVKIVRG